MKRIVWWALIAVAVYFAVQGGEYSTKDLYVLHRRTGTLTTRGGLASAPG